MNAYDQWPVGRVDKAAACKAATRRFDSDTGLHAVVVKLVSRNVANVEATSSSLVYRTIRG